MKRSSHATVLFEYIAEMPAFFVEMTREFVSAAVVTGHFGKRMVRGPEQGRARRPAMLK